MAKAYESRSPEDDRMLKNQSARTLAIKLKNGFWGYKAATVGSKKNPEWRLPEQ